MEKIFAYLLVLLIAAGGRTAVKEVPVRTKVDEKLDSMTVEEKVGQLFLPWCPIGGGADLVAQYQPAGFILCGWDFSGKTREEVQAAILSYQAEAKIPLLIAVDEEGGSVVRVSDNGNLAEVPFASPQDVYRSGGIEGIRQDTERKAQLLLDLGVNVNLAPVCDVSTDPGDFMYDRSLGVPAEETAQVIKEMVEVMEANGLSGSLKHFPGYGGNFDTHTGISWDERPYEQFLQQDFLPFRSGIEAGAPCVLVSHNIVACMDGDWPASLSPRVHEILRQELHFEGVIMTDDLSMDAIQQRYPNGASPAVQALLAGNDLLLTSYWEEDQEALLQAVQDGTVPLERVEESVRRILEWKADKGLL